MFTADDKAFIRAILSNPAERTAWLVYADWLEEHANPAHAEFLRLMARHGQLSNTELEWYTVEERLQELRGTLDPNWVTVFDRPKLENCDTAFRFRCPKQWENLKVLDEPAVRYCTSCDKKVYYCRTLEEAQRHARQERCVAIQLGVPRYPGDLPRPLPVDSDEREHTLVGMIEMGDFDADYFPIPEPPRRPWWKFW